MIYLDNAATTLIKPVEVQRSMLNAMTTAASPGRGGHEPAMRAADIVYACRARAAEFFYVPEPERVVFTMNATHALNIAINSLVQKGTKVLVSGFEHNSVMRPLVSLGADVKIADAPLFDSAATLEAFRNAIDDVELVICTHVSNVFGFVLPVYEISAMCREKAIPFVLDASQSAGVLEVDFEKLGAAYIAMPGHKALFGPQGTGILLCGMEGIPLISGGSGSNSKVPLMPAFLPDMHEAGTHNVPGIAGLLAGLEYVAGQGLEQINHYEHELLTACVNELSEIEEIQLFTGSEKTQSGLFSFYSSRMDCEEIAMKLALEGVCVRAGLHCAPYAHTSAGTLEKGTVRVSFSPFVTLENAHDFCGILQNLLR